MVAVQEKAALYQGTVLWPFLHEEYAHSAEGFQEGSRIICDRFESMEVDSSINKIQMTPSFCVLSTWMRFLSRFGLPRFAQSDKRTAR